MRTLWIGCVSFGLVASACKTAGSSTTPPESQVYGKATAVEDEESSEFWAFGKPPQGAAKPWPDPGFQSSGTTDWERAKPWPEAWPESPVDDVPYSERTHTEEGALSLGEDYHFDCDDFALGYHLWCQNNAGRKCWSIRVKYHADYSSAPDPLSHAKGTYELDGNDMTVVLEGASEKDFRLSKDLKTLTASDGTELTPDLQKDVKRLGSDIQGTFSHIQQCDHEAGDFCVKRYSFKPQKTVKTELDPLEDTNHVMAVHEIESDDPGHRFCFVEYYNHTVYGCWDQASDRNGPQVPDEILDVAGPLYPAYAFKQITKVSPKAVHISNDAQKPVAFQPGLEPRPREGFQVESQKEPPYFRFQRSRHIFAHVTKLDGWTAKPADPEYLEWVQGIVDRIGLDALKGID